MNHSDNGWSEVLKGWRKTLWTRTWKIFHYSLSLDTNYFCDLRQVVSFFGLLFSHLKGYSGKGRLMNLIKGSFKFKFWNSQMTNLQNRLFPWRKHVSRIFPSAIVSADWVQSREKHCSTAHYSLLVVSWFRPFLLNKETKVELMLFLHICGLVYSKWRWRYYTRLRGHSYHIVVQLITCTAVGSCPGLAVIRTGKILV